jgi:uncharacterized protein YbbK (DUF523 family)
MASPRNSKLSQSGKTRYKFIVSACLIGVNCTFRGGNKKNSKVTKLFRDGYAVGLCPEIAGGLKVPRENCEIVRGGGKEVLSAWRSRRVKRGGFQASVITASGKNVTGKYIRGAAAVLANAKRLGIKEAILKSKSPACGVGRIYDGRFSDTLKDGDGILASMLRREGFKIYTPENYF